MTYRENPYLNSIYRVDFAIKAKNEIKYIVFIGDKERNTLGGTIADYTMKK
jgi:hypothetical protein